MLHGVQGLRGLGALQSTPLGLSKTAITIQVPIVWCTLFRSYEPCSAPHTFSAEPGICCWQFIASVEPLNAPTVPVYGDSLTLQQPGAPAHWLWECPSLRLCKARPLLVGKLQNTAWRCLHSTTLLGLIIYIHENRGRHHGLGDALQKEVYIHRLHDGYMRSLLWDSRASPPGFHR